MEAREQTLRTQNKDRLQIKRKQTEIAEYLVKEKTAVTLIVSEYDNIARKKIGFGNILNRPWECTENFATDLALQKLRNGIINGG